MRQLDRSHWPELYRLMSKRGFPAVPSNYAEAKPHFETLKIFGVERDGAIRTYFLFGPPEEGICFLDVICDAEAQGKWATPATLKAVHEQAFDVMGLRCVWVQTHNKKALIAALDAGFVPATPIDVKLPVLVMTPRIRPNWLRA